MPLNQPKYTAFTYFAATLYCSLSLVYSTALLSSAAEILSFKSHLKGALEVIYRPEHHDGIGCIFSASIFLAPSTLTRP